VLQAISEFLAPRDVYEHMSGVAAMAFLKKDPHHPECGAFLSPHGIQPIGKTHAIQKLCSKPLMAAASQRHGPSPAKLGQMGAGVSSGIEVVSSCPALSPDSL